MAAVIVIAVLKKKAMRPKANHAAVSSRQYQEAGKARNCFPMTSSGTHKISRNM